jgi:hypothetical protein
MVIGVGYVEIGFEIIRWLYVAMELFNNRTGNTEGEV